MGESVEWARCVLSLVMAAVAAVAGGDRGGDDDGGLEQEGA